MSGWIGSSFAVTPFGVGTPATATAPPKERFTGARYLNPATRDYEVDDEGELARMPPVRQRMLLALTTIKRSSSVAPSLGTELPAKMGKDFEQVARNAVLEATATIVASGDARIDAVQAIVTQVGRAVIIVSYTDLTTGSQDVLSVTP